MAFQSQKLQVKVRKKKKKKAIFYIPFKYIYKYLQDS